MSRATVTAGATTRDAAAGDRATRDQGPGDPAAGQPAGAPPGTGPGTARSWRAPLALAVLVLLGGVVVVLLRPSPSTGGYLDPGNTGAQGTRALATLLAGRGQRVVRVTSVAAARGAAAGQAATVVITSPYLLSPGQLGTLARLPGDLLVVEPDSSVLSALGRPGRPAPGHPAAPGHSAPGGPRVTVAGAAPDGPAGPGCTLAAATTAGGAWMGGVLMRVTGAGGWRCYPVDGHPSLVRYAAGGRVITLLGSGEPLTNHYLASGGDAALALNLLRGPSGIVWLVPSPPALAAGGPKSLLQEIPGPAYLVAGQLLIAAALTAAWRARRLGPLVSEPLPVVIRASETVEGHGRLYRSRRSRGRAAAVLRAAALHRITVVLALPPAVPPGAACAAIAARTGRGRAEVQAVLFGPDPRDDAALVALGRDIDRLEREVRTP